MATQSAFCGVCDSQQISKPSVIWCSECSEGLCEDCQGYHSHSRGTRHHVTIPIAEYHTLPSDVLEITEFCSEHNERFQMYCKKHDRPCCRRCISDSHNMCIEIVVIDDVIKNVKTSNSVFEIEKRLKELSQNTEQIRAKLRNNLDLLNKEKNKIQDDIAQTRKIINDYLDKIQEELISELITVEEGESIRMKEHLKSLEQTDAEIKNIKGSLDTIKQHASDLQIYLSVRKTESDLTKKEELIKAACGDKIFDVAITCNFDKTLRNLSTKLKKFGTISVEKMPSEVNLVSWKNKQAQLMVANVPHRSIDLINLNLKRTVNTGLLNVRGCCMLPDSRMAFSSYSNLLKVINTDGSDDFSLSTLYDTFDIKYVEKDNTLVVTGGCEPYISIICVESKGVKNYISVGSYNDGITVLDDSFVYCARDKGIKKLNPNNNAIKIIARNVGDLSYITTFGGNIYYTNPEEHKVICCNLNGNQKWEFSNKNVLDYPLGITVDSYGNVFVVGYNSENLLVISPDGQRYRELLTETDSLCYPQVVQYDHASNMLLIANANETAFLFNTV